MMVNSPHEQRNLSEAAGRDWVYTLLEQGKIYGHQSETKGRRWRNRPIQKGRMSGAWVGTRCHLVYIYKTIAKTISIFKPFAALKGFFERV